MTATKERGQTAKENRQSSSSNHVRRHIQSWKRRPFCVTGVKALVCMKQTSTGADETTKTGIKNCTTPDQTWRDAGENRHLTRNQETTLERL